MYTPLYYITKRFPSNMYYKKAMATYRDRTTTGEPASQRPKLQLQFIAKVELPFQLKMLSPPTVYVACTYTTEWDLTVIDEQRLVKYAKLQDALSHAVPFTLGVHSLEEANLPTIPETARAYAVRNDAAIQQCSLVSMRGTNDDGWEGAGFFHPSRSGAIQQYIARMRAEKIPLIARGALFHWVMLRMAGYAATATNVNFILVDSWQGRLFLSEDEQHEITADVKFALQKEPTREYKQWLTNGAQHGFKVESNMLTTAFTPDMRARLWLYVHNSKKDAATAHLEDVKMYALKNWRADASETHAYYAQEVKRILTKVTKNYDEFTANNITEIQKKYCNNTTVFSWEKLGQAFVGAMYINKRVKSIKEKRDAGYVHTIRAQNKRSPMFRNGFYSAMQETEIEDGYVKFSTMPQLVAAAL